MCYKDAVIVVWVIEFLLIGHVSMVGDISLIKVCLFAIYPRNNLCLSNSSLINNCCSFKYFIEKYFLFVN